MSWDSGDVFFFGGGWGENCEWLCCSKHPDSLVLCSILFTTIIAQKAIFVFPSFPASFI